ncbi:glycosyltransferase family 2 protein, partial [bacterium]|nr:glycosyltransferase family 2 protein [bacterium]
PKVSIQIVTWNSREYIGDCLDSIFSQTFKDFTVLIIDNASTDGTVEFIEKKYKNIYILRNSKNLGFSRAHNQGIKLTNSKYVFVLNPDVILEPTFLEEIIKKAEKNKKIAAFGGKLLKIKFIPYHRWLSGDAGFTNRELNEKIKTNVIDSTGLKIYRSRMVVDRGEGQEDKGKYNKQEKVFGISGACVLYRRKALEDIKIFDEYFDEDFFAYKEDVDLAWRLQLRGWSALYCPNALAYHFRSTIGHRGKLNRIDISKQAKKSPRVNFFSYRNHLWLILKNDYWQNFFCHSFFIFWYQFKKILWLLIFRPKILFQAELSFWRRFKKMLAKRKHILRNAKVNAKEIKKWFY